MIATIEIYPPVIAHRGACTYAPENTFAAFAKAAQLGIQWLEFDVMLSADAKPIVFHDETLERTTTGSGPVQQYAYAHLAALDAGSWFDQQFASERIPALADVMVFLKQHELSANIEIKASPGKEQQTVVETLNIVQSYYPQPNPHILFSSFSIDALRYLRQYSPDCHLGLLLHEWEKNWETICTELNCVAVDVNEAIMTKEKAAHIKAIKKLLLCYTVNNPMRAKELYAWGVDAVFSDVPDVILNSLKEG